jgi:Cu+-exporting ATPase
LIPCDVVLESGTAYIDNSFVTGESDPLTKYRGDKVFAGGRQKGAAITAVVAKEVSQSYLTDLWNNDVFKKDKENDFQGITDRISRRFTIIILSVALIAGVVWAFIDPSRVAVIVTAILIVACPCALALSAPFALGNALRIFGKYGFYLKNASVVERLSEISHVVFDKTGTLTHGDKGQINFEGTPLSSVEEEMIAAALRQSNHPLSRRISDFLDIGTKMEVQAFSETPGKGTYAVINGRDIKIGSAEFVGAISESSRKETRVYIAIDNINRGYFAIRSRYRNGMSSLLENLRKSFRTSLISGDNNSEQSYLRDYLGWKGEMYFEQKPIDKLNHIEGLKQKGEHILMVGDGLNDAGALQSADVGVSLSENINNFSPACDGILTDQNFSRLDDFIELAKGVKRIIYQSFAISFAYNAVGLTIAVSGHLSPVIAAILMPVSSISVVIFVTVSTNLTARKKLKSINNTSGRNIIAE